MHTITRQLKHGKQLILKEFGYCVIYTLTMLFMLSVLTRGNGERLKIDIISNHLIALNFSWFDSIRFKMKRL